ncbi:hypothetical protein KGQ34_03060, partial [Patescibacteria group bacterium]|nr:hypothetical protein [Patescibacteria group bacterium]
MVSQKKIVVGLIIVLGTAFFFSFAGKNGAILAVKSKFFSFVAIVGKPIFSFAAKVSDVREGVLHYQEITEENHALRDKERVDLEKLASVQEIEKENVSLREALGLKTELGRAVIPAHIAGLFRDIREEIIIIDKGTDDGAAFGNVVVGKNHVLVGRILEAY